MSIRIADADKTKLRFAIGTRVECNCGTWKPGTIVKHFYAQKSFPEGSWLRVSTWLYFEGSVPPASGNFGLKLHGAVHEVSSKCRADEWCAGHCAGEA